MVNKKIMLVEDHELTRIGLKVALEKFGDLEVIAETASGLESIKLAEEVQPDVILMDIGLRELDGIEATKRIKANNPDLKIIMLTSHEGEDEVFASFTSGADGYALKESSPDQLRTAIQTVSLGDLWISSSIAEKVLRAFCGVKPQNNGNKIASKDFTGIVPLSDRELEVLRLIVDGKSNQEIAQGLFLSLATVKSHVRNILTKLCVDDRTQAAVKAMKSGLVS